MNLRSFDKILLSVSGGKDSQAMLQIVHATAAAQGVVDRLQLINIDTGAEWPESAVQCKLLAEAYHVPLQVILPNRPIIEEVKKRGKWPAPNCRFCTANCKRDPYEKYVRSIEAQKILHVTGERKEESHKRSKMEEISSEARIHTRLREVTRWRPMLPFTEDDVWSILAGCRVPRHPAYDYGCKRVSCELCIFARDADLVIGAEHNPEMAEAYLQVERDIAYTFRVRKTLSSILAR